MAGQSDHAHTLMTHLIATVNRRALSGPVTTVKEHHDTIIPAIDMLIARF